MKKRSSRTVQKAPQWKDTTRSATPPTQPSPRLKQPPRECDFYDDPTILSRLILHGHYQAAIHRLREHPNEASVWVRRERRTTIAETTTANTDRTSAAAAAVANNKNRPAVLDTLGVYKPHAEPQVYASYRQLPIHTACQQLLLLPRNHHVITPLLYQLIHTYPAGCGYPDHTGQTPLQLVVRSLSSSTSEDAISSAACRRLVVVLLTAAPRVLDRIDTTNTNIQLLTQDERIQKLLEQGRPFWERVRQAAIQRRQRRKPDATVVWSEGSQHSVRLQGRNVAENTTMEMTTNNAIHDWSAPDDLPWSQVERRCEVLEGLLAQAYLPQRDTAAAGGSKEEASASSSTKQQQQQPSADIMDGLRHENQELHVLVNLYKQRILELEDMLLERADVDDDDGIQDDTLSALTPGETKTSASSSSNYSFPVACERPTRFDSLSTLPVDLGTTTTTPTTANSASPVPLPGFSEDLFGDYDDAAAAPPRTTPAADHHHHGNEGAYYADTGAAAGVKHATRTTTADSMQFSATDDPSSYDTTDLDTILAEAELWNAQRLLPVMVRLWNEVELPPPSGSSLNGGGGGALSIASANGRARTPAFVKDWRHERHASGLILQGNRYLL